MADIPEVTSEAFDGEVLESPMPVLVDLYAPWCAPCKVMGQVLGSLLPQFEGKVKVVKINIDEQPELAAAFNVSSIPLILLIHQGKVVDRVVGAAAPSRILTMVQKFVPKVSTPFRCCSY